MSKGKNVKKILSSKIKSLNDIFSEEFWYILKNEVGEVFSPEIDKIFFPEIHKVCFKPLPKILECTNEIVLPKIDEIIFEPLSYIIEDVLAPRAYCTGRCKDACSQNHFVCVHCLLF